MSANQSNPNRNSWINIVIPAVFWLIGSFVFLPAWRVSAGEDAGGERAANILRFNTQFEQCVQSEAKPEEAVQWSRLWDIMDELVVESLNTEEDIQATFDLLPRLAGYRSYRDPQATPPETIGNSIFSTGFETNYALYRLLLDQNVFYIGVYNDTHFDVAGSLVNRLSIYHKRRSRWVKTDHYAGDMTLVAYFFPILLRHQAFFTIEDFSAADRIEGSLKLWQFAPDGTLRLLDREERLVDYAVQVQTDPITILFTSFPEHLCEPVLGVRIQSALHIAPHGGQMQKTITEVNPWVKVFNEYMGAYAQQNLSRAQTYVENPDVLATFPHEGCPAIRHEEGDLANGTGQIELTNGWIIQFERTPEQGWVIVNATDTHAQSFDNLEHALLVPEQVVTLAINDLALKQLAPQLGLLINLKELDLSCSESLEELPKEIGTLRKLEKLVIDNGTGCQMNVSLPPSIGQLENLRTLTLYGAIDPREDGSQKRIPASKLKALPNTLGNLRNLEELNLGRNGLRAVPPAVASLRNLKRLLLNYNDIHELPAFIGELKNLQELSLLGNGGVSLPLSLTKLHGLTVFMGNNSLSLEAQEQLRRMHPDITFDFENDYDDSAANEEDAD